MDVAAWLVSDEPGIGKSRLTAEMSERIHRELHTHVRYSCSPQHQDSSLYPFIIQLERAAGFALDGAVEQKLYKLQELLAPVTPRDDEITLLAKLLSLPSTASTLRAPPPRRRTTRPAERQLRRSVPRGVVGSPASGGGGVIPRKRQKPTWGACSVRSVQDGVMLATR
jgi:predicted ATPase